MADIPHTWCERPCAVGWPSAPTRPNVPPQGTFPTCRDRTMDLLRRFSICQRIFYGLTLFSLLTVVVGVGGGWVAHGDAARMAQLAQSASGAGGEVVTSMKAIAADAEAHARRTMLVAVLVGLAGVVCAAVLRASVKGPIEGTIQSIIRLGGGDLETKINSPGRDEVSWMNAELNGMRKKLNKMVGEVRASSESVLMAATEIAQGNSDLSGRTESQAAALQQTSSAMNQLTTTVRDNAKQPACDRCGSPAR